MDGKTKQLIIKRVREFEELSKRSVSVLEYKDWADRAYAIMNYRKIPWSDEIYNIHKFLSGFIGETTHEGFRVAKNAAARMYNYLEEQLLTDELDEGGLVKEATSKSNVKVEGRIKDMNDNKVFIVHGHDEAKKWELKNFLAGLKLDPIILHEQDDLGMTIIEKFEYYASQTTFAFVLLTPDDKAPDEQNTAEFKWRARQNVIMELGWFMAKLGRRRVVIIHKGQVEIPSDILGVLYVSFKDSILEAGERIRKRLKGEGLIP
jgi:predicted nucleotide-binding protein